MSCCGGPRGDFGAHRELDAAGEWLVDRTHGQRHRREAGSILRRAASPWGRVPTRARRNGGDVSQVQGHGKKQWADDGIRRIRDGVPLAEELGRWDPTGDQQVGGDQVHLQFQPLVCQPPAGDP